MNTIFSDRISDVPRSFIREILKVTADPKIISFAGGLPNREFFPLEQIRESTLRVLDNSGRDLLQYGASEGLPGLREIISRTYRDKAGLNVPVENILITSGSQQGLDLLGKVLLNRDDSLVIEEPGYLGAIQSFSIYEPRFCPVPVSSEGMDVRTLKNVLDEHHPKLMYTVPNFQNPSGISYSEENRQAVAAALQGTDTLLIEDDPYGALRFSGTPKSSFYNSIPQQTIMLGSFSKVVAPGLRVGWLVAPDNIMEKVLVAKQASDLHSSHLNQAIIADYLTTNSLDEHVALISRAYGEQCGSMIEAMERHFPSSVTFTHPEGGMFLWAELGENNSALRLFEAARKKGVVFVPGDPFYLGRAHVSSLRLNFSCVDVASIQTGIALLARAMEQELT